MYVCFNYTIYSLVYTKYASEHNKWEHRYKRTNSTHTRSTRGKTNSNPILRPQASRVPHSSVNTTNIQLPQVARPNRSAAPPTSSIVDYRLLSDHARKATYQQRSTTKYSLTKSIHELKIDIETRSHRLSLRNGSLILMFNYCMGWGMANTPRRHQCIAPKRPKLIGEAITHTM